MIHIIKCLQYDHQSDLIKYSQDYRGFQGVSFFFRKTKGNARDSDCQFKFRHYKGRMD